MHYLRVHLQYLVDNLCSKSIKWKLKAAKHTVKLFSYLFWLRDLNGYGLRWIVRDVRGCVSRVVKPCGKHYASILIVHQVEIKSFFSLVVHNCFLPLSFIGIVKCKVQCKKGFLHKTEFGPAFLQKVKRSARTWQRKKFKGRGPSLKSHFERDLMYLCPANEFPF